MRPETCAWLDGLRDAVSARRRTHGLPPPETAAAAAAERSILAAHLAAWLDTMPALRAARRTFAARHGAVLDPEPAIVITTSPPGLEVVTELLAADAPRARDLRPRIVSATESEYRGWCMRHPDETHRFHVNHWSWIKTRVPPQRHAEFARHPLADGQRYWLHRTGTAGAGTADARTADLWRFDGREAVLLEPRVAEARVAPPRP